MEERMEGARFRLSPQQLRGWLLRRGNPAYAAQCALLIQGRVHPGRLREAVQDTVDRHGILRTAFRRSPGLKVPFQWVLDTGTAGWRCLDLRALGRREQARETSEILRQELRRDFDLEAGPVLHA